MAWCWLLRRVGCLALRLVDGCYGWFVWVEVWVSGQFGFVWVGIIYYLLYGRWVLRLVGFRVRDLVC